MSTDPQEPAVRKMRGWAAAAVATVLIITAWGLAAITPDDDDAQTPFFVDAAVGQEAAGRNLLLTVHDITAAREPVAGGWQPAAGDAVWILVEVTAQATSSENFATLSGVFLRVGERTYRASERPRSMFRESLGVGIATSGSFAFEVPAIVMDAPSATVEIGYRADARLDSVVRLQFDPASLTVIDTADLASTEWGVR